MIAMREQRASASSMLWVVRMAARFLTFSRMTSHMNRRDDGSMPVEGSSSTATFGEPIIEMQNDSLRLVPPLRSLAT